MKIKTKIFLIVAFFALLSIVVVAGVFNYFYVDSLNKEISEHLRNITYAKSLHVDTILTGKIEKVELLTRGAVLFSEILKTPIGSEGYSENFIKVQNRLKQISQDNFYEVSLLNNKGVIISSNNSERIGEDRSGHKYFSKPRNKIFISKVYFCDTSQQYALAIFVPIFDVDNKEKVVGTFVAKTGIDDISNIVTNEFKENREFYLIDKDRLMVTQSRFIEDSILKQKIDSRTAQDCFALKENYSLGHNLEDKIVVPYMNYRGRSVIGHYAYFPQMNWCLIAEIEEDEALAPLQQAWKFGIILIGIMAVFILSLSKVMGNRISRPIEDLTKNVKKIQQGDLSSKIITKTEDEIGVLAKVFDKMRITLKDSLDNINKKVKQQTASLEQKQVTMENQQKALVNILGDIEEEKEKTQFLAHDLEKFKLAVDNTSDHVVITNTEGIVLYANRAAEEMTGFNLKEILGEKAGVFNKRKKLVGQEFCDNLSKQVLKNKNSFLGGTKRKRKNKEEYDALVSVFPILDKKENVLFFVDIEKDITKEREIDQAKTEFVSLASHQLRTPLSAINWYTEMLLDGDAGKINKAQKEYLQEVSKGSRRMVDLVNSLLNVSRLELGTFTVEPELTDIKILAKEMVKELTPKVKKKKLKLTEKYDAKLSKMQLDKKLVTMIFQNLLSNAVKYTPEKGSISLKILKKKKFVEITVADTGMGIPKSQQHKIFSKLFRADNVKEADSEGTGLGLYIIKSIVDHSGGQISFISRKNKGTTFSVKIPLSGMRRRGGTKQLG